MLSANLHGGAVVASYPFDDSATHRSGTKMDLFCFFVSNSSLSPRFLLVGPGRRDLPAPGLHLRLQPQEHGQQCQVWWGGFPIHPSIRSNSFRICYIRNLEIFHEWQKPFLRKTLACSAPGPTGNSFVDELFKKFSMINLFCTISFIDATLLILVTI